jgi:hypothetical protein
MYIVFRPVGHVVFVAVIVVLSIRPRYVDDCEQIRVFDVIVALVAFIRAATVSVDVVVVVVVIFVVVVVVVVVVIFVAVAVIVIVNDFDSGVVGPGFL